ncbi:hypothetical protein [Paraflavitalea speifideaquila]|uniref:hypothetical protein n=1 Tax=Paraflavitalea speifideaquila TaxID=3076558 RepID=UPI0028E3AB85|nr:hypothetical protein [Paraflavitalea speifideiaquila]
MYDYNSMEGYDKPVRNARILLFVIAALQLVPIFLIPPMDDLAKYITIGIYVFFAGVFAALALWTKRKPYTAIITALCVYTGIILLAAYFQPSSIFQGLILKVVVYVMLIVGLRNAKDVQEWLDTKNKR